MFKRVVKQTARLLGVDIMRLAKSPAYTLLGIRQLPINTIIDVGANVGQFAAHVLTIFPEAHLYCFEPLSKPFRELQRWASNQENVKAFNFALGDVEGTTTMFHHVDHNTSSSLLASTDLSSALYPFTHKQDVVDVQVTTLDAALKSVAESLLPDVLIKLDVQGYEEHVIKGGKRTFSQATACIAEVCLDDLYSGQADFKRLVVMLDEFGFRYIGNLEQSYGDDGHVIFLDAVFVKKT